MKPVLFSVFANYLFPCFLVLHVQCFSPYKSCDNLTCQMGKLYVHWPFMPVRTKQAASTDIRCLSLTLTVSYI